MCYPVSTHRTDIIRTVKSNPVTIICAETGAGKSTQVPQYLYDEGYDVVVTVPSRTAATSLAKRVSDELGYPIGDIAGYQTGFEKCMSDHTRILYTTEGLQLIKELHNKYDDPNKVLIIDEIQEAGTNVETLLAWANKKLSEGWKSKIVIMSASVNLEFLSRYFNNAPIIKIEGKLFDIEMCEAHHEKFVETIADLATKKRNVLAFVPGKSEISHTIQELEKIIPDAHIFPFHADLSFEEQNLVFEKSDKPKVVVATNIAQTSITISDIDAVVDSGLERNIQILDGVETLTTDFISYSDHIQRKGRAGRTKPGIYIWCCEKKIHELNKYPTPAILTSQITEIVLKLASVEVNANDVNFLNQPPIERIEEAQKTLRVLGAFDENNQITEIGKIMVMLPVSVRYARMLIEAEKYGVLEDMITIVSIQQCGGIKWHNVPYTRFSKELKSDILADLDCFNVVRQKLNNSDSGAFEGIIKRNYYRILELRSKLYDILYRIYGEVSCNKNRNDILKACCAGLVEFLYIKGENAWYTSPKDEYRRKLNLFSATLAAKLILGLPKNITKFGPDGSIQTLYILSSAIMVTPEYLKEIAPALYDEEIEYQFNFQTNSYEKKVTVRFNEIVIDVRYEDVSDKEEKLPILINWLTKNTQNFDTSINVSDDVKKMLLTNHKHFSRKPEPDIYGWYKKTILSTFNGVIPNLRKTKTIGALTASTPIRPYL